jgi:hypothetical protein
MNWGTKITISFILFAGFVFTLVFKMIFSGNDLVASSYYRSGEQVNTELNLRDASADIQKGFSVKPDETGKPEVLFAFDSLSEKPENVTYNLICLSADKGDQKGTLELEKSKTGWSKILPIRNLRAGNWLCEVRGSLVDRSFVVKGEFRVYNNPTP